MAPTGWGSHRLRRHRLPSPCRRFRKFPSHRGSQPTRPKRYGITIIPTNAASHDIQTQCRSSHALGRNSTSAAPIPVLVMMLIVTVLMLLLLQLLLLLLLPPTLSIALFCSSLPKPSPHLLRLQAERRLHTRHESATLPSPPRPG